MRYRTYEIDGYLMTYNPRLRAYKVTGPGIIVADYYPAAHFSPLSIAYALWVARDSDDAARSESLLDRGGAL